MSLIDAVVACSRKDEYVMIIIVIVSVFLGFVVGFLVGLFLEFDKKPQSYRPGPPRARPKAPSRPRLGYNPPPVKNVERPVLPSPKSYASPTGRPVRPIVLKPMDNS